MKIIFKNFMKIFSPFIFGVFITATSLAILLPYMATKHEVYHDIILENVANLGTNKSGELHAIWISLFIGIFSICIFKYFLKKRNDKYFKNLLKENIKLDLLGIGIFLIPVVYLLILKQQISFYLLFIGVVYYISYVFYNKNVNLTNKVMLLLFSIYFFFLSLKSILDKIVINREVLKIEVIDLLVIIFFLSIIFINRKNLENKINQYILFFQFTIPLIFFTFLTNKYTLNGEIYKIKQPKSYIIIISLIVITLLFFNIIQYLKYKKNKSRTIIMFSSVITVFVLYNYFSPSFIHSGDLWHIGEETNPWHQLFNKGMILYKDYNGTSGLYGLVTGFFQNMILDGNELSFALAHSLTNIFWSILVGSLCYILVGSGFSLLLGLFVNIPEYNRVLLLFVSLLILINPKLIKSRYKWIQMYFLLSILSLFYYPLNGIALILGCGVFFLIQIYNIFREKNLKREFKSFMFWINNFLLIGIFFIVYKYIFGILKNILLLSSQSKLADGITAYGSDAPEWFFNFWQSETLKKYFWGIFLFTVITSIILFFFYTLIYYILNKKGELKKKIQSPIFLILSSITIILPINYSYTLIRLDAGAEFARTASIIVVLLGYIYSILLYKYGTTIFGRNIRYILIGIIFGTVYLVQGNSIGNEENYVKKIYEVPSNFTYVDGNKLGIPKLGKGFMPINTVESLKIIKENLDKVLSKNDLFWPNWRRELLSMFNKKTPVKIDSMKLTKSLKASKENLEMLKKNPPALIMDVMATESYYTYRWIVDSGYIRYLDRNEAFWIRPDKYQKIFGDLKEGKQKMLTEIPEENIVKIPYSLGNSMKTLDKIFSDKKNINLNNLKLEYNQTKKIENLKFKISNLEDPYVFINLPEKINGSDFDFIYIELKSNKKYKEIKDSNIQLFWDSQENPIRENTSIIFGYGNGKFLIPVGINPTWTFSNIEKLRIDFDSSIGVGTEFEIKEIKFLKLNLNRKE